MKVGLYEQRDGEMYLIATSNDNGRFDPPVALKAGIAYVRVYRHGDEIRVLPINALRSTGVGQSTDGS